MSTGTTKGAVAYQYNKLGTVRAPLNGDMEILLDVKLVQEPYNTPDFLATVGGQAATLRSAGFVLDFMPVSELGLENFNEITNEWRPVKSTSTYAVVGKLPE